VRPPAITRTPTPMETPWVALLTMDSSRPMELGEQVFEVEVRVIAAPGKRVGQIGFQVPSSDVERAANIDSENCIISGYHGVRSGAGAGGQGRASRGDASARVWSS